jgi:hypothetical protein
MRPTGFAVPHPEVLEFAGENRRQRQRLGDLQPPLSEQELRSSHQILLGACQ